MKPQAIGNCRGAATPKGSLQAVGANHRLHKLGERAGVLLRMQARKAAPALISIYRCVLKLHPVANVLQGLDVLGSRKRALSRVIGLQGSNSERATTDQGFSLGGAFVNNKIFHPLTSRLTTRPQWR